MIYLAEYYMRYAAGSADRRHDKLRRVVIEARAWDVARNWITTVEETNNPAYKIEFERLSLMDGVVLWK